MNIKLSPLWAVRKKIMQNVPKWLIVILGLFLVVFVGIMVLDKGQTLRDRWSGRKPDNTLTVSAEGKVAAVPDMATITLGVVSQGANASEVQDKNSEKINKIINYVKAEGISKDDISTSQFTIYPQYNYANGRNEIIGYEARQTITIKVRGVDKSTEKLGKIMDGATNNGANEVSGMYLGFDDPDNLRQQAREKAIEKAKEKARELARVAGLELGRVVSISETGSPSLYSTYPSYAYGMGGGGMAMEKSVSPNIEPGQQDIVEQMSVVFEVK